MLAQQEGQQHQQTTIMNDPPNVDVAVNLRKYRIRIANRVRTLFSINNVHLLVGIGEGSDSFGHNQRHLVGRCGVNRIDKDAPRSILLY